MGKYLKICSELEWVLIGNPQYVIRLKKKRYDAYRYQQATGFLPSMSNDCAGINNDQGLEFINYNEEVWVNDKYWLSVINLKEFTKKPYQPYFAICDYRRFKEIRLHFMDNGIDHVPEKSRALQISKQEIKAIEDHLQKNPKDWITLLFAWNYTAFNTFTRSGYYQEYIAGNLDAKFRNSPRYVPSTQPIPNWEIHFTDERNDLSAKNEKSTTA